MCADGIPFLTPGSGKRHPPPPNMGEKPTGAVPVPDLVPIPRETPRGQHLEPIQFGPDLELRYDMDEGPLETVQVVVTGGQAFQFPCNVTLFRNRLSPTPLCPQCVRSNPQSQQRESFGHIQCWCPTLAEPRTAAHHSICRELLASIKRIPPRRSILRLRPGRRSHTTAKPPVPCALLLPLVGFDSFFFWLDGQHICGASSA